MTLASNPSDLITGHKSTKGWWDGPDKYENVNRNVISAVQREISQTLLLALFHDKFKINVGGTGNPEIKFYGVNIDGSGEIFADTTDLPFPDNSVDFILSSHTLEHVRDVEKAILEWIRVLKPGGIFYTIIPDKTVFTHANEMDSLHPYYASSEMSPSDFSALIERINQNIKTGKYIKCLVFNARQNNLDFDYMGEVCLR